MVSVNKPSNERCSISPEERKRLQTWFDHGSKSAKTGNFDYALDLLAKCVNGDPSNPVYVQGFWQTCSQKYNNSPKNVSKLVGMKAVGARTTLSRGKDAEKMIEAGVEVLVLDPWDLKTLTAMADASGQLNYTDAQLFWLKVALDTNPKDAETNRMCALALGKIGRFDEAIACWRRVQIAKPSDIEAPRMISELAIERTIKKGGYSEAESAEDVRSKNEDEQNPSGPAALTPEQRLEKAIQKNPDDIGNYRELCDLFQRGERYAEAEKMMEKIVKLSGGEIGTVEQLEDLRLRKARFELDAVRVEAEKTRADEAVKKYKQLRVELNQLEMEVYRSRSERYPTNAVWKYELGLRLKKAQKFNEAIQALQAAARGDSKRKGQIQLELGECFHHIKQYRLAMQNYQGALESLGIGDQDLRKKALYRAGCLSQALNELENAEKYLTELAGIDFGYEDVAARLDKINRLRNNQ